MKLCVMAIKYIVAPAILRRPQTTRSIFNLLDLSIMKEYFMDHPVLSIFLRVFGKRHITLVTDDPALYILPPSLINVWRDRQ